MLNVAGEMKGTFENVTGQWTVRQVQKLGSLGKVHTWGTYDDVSMEPLRTETASPLSGSDDKLRTTANYVRIAGKALVSFGRDGKPSETREVVLHDQVPRDFEDLWIFRLSHSQLNSGDTGKFARIEVSDPQQYSNWYREIPVELTISDQEYLIPGTDTKVSVWGVIARDEEAAWTLSIAKDGTGLLRAEVTRDEHLVVLERR
ncbi:MAG: hypothetical protein IID36_11720 [Planctomycetes bacterium]|nr:hypothetical protein [Planctomycetota bacterium]